MASTSSSGKKKNYRKKQPSIIEEESNIGSGSNQQSEQIESGHSLQQKLLQTKHLQKLRARSNGVNAGVGAELSLLASNDIVETTQRSLDETFTTQSDGPELNMHMEKYIEEQLAKKKANTTNDNTNGNKDSDLYTTPEHLKVSLCICLESNKF